VSKVPEDLRYTRDHEWIKPEGRRVRVGITDYAQGELTDVVYVELPPDGRRVKKGDVVATVESVKTVSEVYSPVAGTVVEVNRELEDHPELLNRDPYGKGWIVVVEAPEPIDEEGLIPASAYRAHIGET
jgi:glycine cleavage system H protein